MSLRRPPVATAFAVIALLAAPPLAAQIGSEGYRFLQSVREGNNTAVVTALNRPGVTMVNTRDVTTGETALHIVVKRGDLRYTSFLLQKGADPNARDGRGNTPMIAAIEAGHGDLVPLLVAGRANPNLANASGETPLIRAVQNRDLTLVRALLAANADPDQRDHLAGRSAREYATQDPRASLIAREFATTPARTRAPVAGPRL